MSVWLWAGLRYQLTARSASPYSSRHSSARPRLAAQRSGHSSGYGVPSWQAASVYLKWRPSGSTAPLEPADQPAVAGGEPLARRRGTRQAAVAGEHLLFVPLRVED